MAVTEKKKTPWWKLWSPFTSGGGGIGGQIHGGLEWAEDRLFDPVGTAKSLQRGAARVERGIYDTGVDAAANWLDMLPGTEGWGLRNSLYNRSTGGRPSSTRPGKPGKPGAPLSAFDRAVEALKNSTTSASSSNPTSGLSPTPIDLSRYEDLIKQNNTLAANRRNHWNRLREDPNSYQSLLPIQSLMGMGPKDWDDPEAIANERANLQYDPQIADAILERKKMELQGKQNRSDIGGWYGLIDKAMGAARTSNTQATKDISAFANDASQDLMASLGGAANSANGAIAAAAQSNNNMLGALGQVQGNYLQNARLNAQLEGTQQQTNQMRLNDQADQLAAQQLAKLRGAKAASASDYRFTMEGQNKDLQSQRLATKAGLLGQNAALNSANINRRLGFEQQLDQVGQDRLTGLNTALGNITTGEKWNADHQLGIAKANIEYDNAMDTKGDNRIINGQAAYAELMKTLVDADGELLGGHKTVDAAWGAIEGQVDNLEKVYPGIKRQVLQRLAAIKAQSKK